MGTSTGSAPMVLVFVQVFNPISVIQFRQTFTIQDSEASKIQVSYRYLRVVIGQPSIRNFQSYFGRHMKEIHLAALRFHHRNYNKKNLLNIFGCQFRYNNLIYFVPPTFHLWLFLNGYIASYFRFRNHFKSPIDLSGSPDILCLLLGSVESIESWQLIERFHYFSADCLDS